MKGQIVRVIAGFYDVISDGEEYRVRGSGNLRNQNISPIVGDFVIFKKDGLLTSVLERNNFLIRPKVANVDQVIIVQSLVEPDYSSLLLNKFLAIIEHSRIKPIILFTKIDLAKINPAKEYEDQGYEVYSISNNDKKTLSQFSKIFKDKLSVFTGQTGAGKSTTINNLASTELETQEISKSLGRGKHTTRVVEIIPWLGGRLIDTPGFSSLSLEMTDLQLSRAFHDFELYSKYCKFPRDCIHDKEEDCEVKRKLKEEKISQGRYHDYIKLLKETK